MLSNSRPWPVSRLLRSAGTDNLPSMVLMVSSHMVAAETCTPCAEVIACRACGPSRGLSSRSHSRAWLSRSSIARLSGLAGFGAVEHLLDVRIDAEGAIVVSDLVLESAEGHRGRLMRHEVRDRCASL